VVFYVDLIFSLSAKTDLSGGFYVKLVDDTYLEIDIFGGAITKSLLCVFHFYSSSRPGTGLVDYLRVALLTRLSIAMALLASRFR
jgi:hypothetical protein